MVENNDGDIVQNYLTRFMQLGTKTELGENITDQLSSLVREASDHIAIWRVGDAIANKARLVSQLRLSADLAAQSSPALARTLVDAAERLAPTASGEVSETSR
ncbi:hypothetical protein [Burkholderia multivorans]|uniref:hypothetical protein n=1 Tax=Burkholderia multivorans TaxID=87883 RepID=UPI000D431BF4|nr:hypothetical protein [Burkholderia multivorans]PRF45802.1 hypothetical protein C6Q10_00580 [Burkholderia multivorans]